MNGELRIAKNELKRGGRSSGIRSSLFAIRYFLLLTLLPAAPAFADESPDEIRTLIDRIARGDEVEAAEAAERLIERLTTPVAEAIGALQTRPAAEQLRLRAALGSLSAALRVRLFRTSLPPEDAQLFDAFQRRYPELVRQLFDDDYRRRIDALRQLPLERDSGVGVLLAGKVDDYDAEVIEAALKIAERLPDHVLARGLARFVRSATDAIRTEQYGPGQEEIVLLLNKYVRESIVIIGAAEYAEAAPLVAEALRFYSAGPFREIFEPEKAIETLGRLGDTSAAPSLFPFLSDQTMLGTHPAGDGRIASERMCDRALRVLLRLYELDRDAYGFYEAERPSGNFVGFLTDDARRDALRQFRVWLHENADRLPHDRPKDDAESKDEAP